MCALESVEGEPIVFVVTVFVPNNFVCIDVLK